MDPEITLLYVHGQSIGYGRLGVCLADALEQRGVQVFDHHEVRDDHAAVFTQDARRQKLTNTVCWVSTPSHARGWYDGQYASIFTMWEATKLPESFRENLHNFDLVVVPSTHNLELFKNYHPNVQYVPLGVDPRVWHPVHRDPPENEFVFLTAGSGDRKGNDLAHKAFLTVFKSWPKDGPTPRLILKSPRGGEFPVPSAFAGRIEVVAGRMTAEAEVNLYHRAHCYVGPARGEGFGLQPLQAMATGCPTILTDAHGHKAFSHLGIPIGWHYAPAAYFIYGDAGDWWEPDFDELCEAMWHAYSDWEKEAFRAQHNAQIITQSMTWDHTAGLFLTAHGRQLSQPYSGSREWFEPQFKRYRVVTKVDWNADIAGNIYQFQQGKEYWEPADVKRILFEAGILHPACVDKPGEDSGLAPHQLAKVQEYSARFGTCESCGQPLPLPVQTDVQAMLPR